MFFNTKVHAAAEFEKSIGSKIIDYGSTNNLFDAMDSTANLLFNIGIALTLTFLVVSGVKFLTSTGDKTKVESAKNSFYYSLLALIILFLINISIKFIYQLFGAGRVETIVSNPVLTKTGL